MKLKSQIFLIWGCIFLLPQIACSQIKTYQFEQIDSLQKIEQKNIAIFIHTDWCKYCQGMINTTFKDDSIINTLNNHYYFIDLNAEEKRKIIFRNHTFKYKPTGTNTGLHELAEQLATIDSKVAYPTLCFLNLDKEIIFQYNQYINSTNLQTILIQLK